MSYIWVRHGERKRMAYENPEGRRLNMLAALEQHGPAPALHWVAYAGNWGGEHLVRMLHELLDRADVPAQPTVVVLDNASIHHARVVQDALPALAERGLSMMYLPPYAPELNAIERLFRAIKHTHLPERRYTTLDALCAAIDQAFDEYEQRLLTNEEYQPRLAA